MSTPSATVTIPVFTLLEDGSIAPNLLFHRPSIKLHSRCIEYPFAAQFLHTQERVLDLGSAQASPLWHSILNAEVKECIFTDYICNFPTPSSLFIAADCRKLPFLDNTFDRIFAISFIEHIGLLQAQTLDHDAAYSRNGDLETLEECKRILKVGGELILTIPFGPKRGYSQCASARNYSYEDIDVFSKILRPTTLDYYEYQLMTHEGWKPAPVASTTLYGNSSWRRIPMTDATACNDKCTDGILCSVWKRE